MKNKYDVLTRKVGNGTWKGKSYGVSLMRAMEILSEMKGKDLEYALRLNAGGFEDIIVLKGVIDMDF